MYTIGRPVQKTTCSNTFQIKVDFMHGDADSYTKVNWHLTETIGEDSLKNEFTLLHAFASREYNDFASYYMGQNEEDRQKRAKKLSTITGIDEAVCHNWLNNHEEPNASYIGSVALAESLSITYFDALGVEHYVVFDK